VILEILRYLGLIGCCTVLSILCSRTFPRHPLWSYAVIWIGLVLVSLVLRRVIRP